MPDVSFLLKFISVIFQYGMLLVLYYFLYFLVKIMYQDLHKKSNLKNYASGQEAVLTITEAADESFLSRRFAFSTALSIGRGADNDIIIDDAYVSHHHAVINQVNQRYILEDLESVNHTYLNDRILQQKTILQNGDRIKIGLVTFKFER